jgi:hypothetical protein
VCRLPCSQATALASSASAAAAVSLVARALISSRPYTMSNLISQALPILIPRPNDAAPDESLLPISSKALQLECSSDNRYIAHVLVIKDGSLSLQPAIVDTPFSVTGSPFEALQKLSQQERSHWYTKTFSIDIKRFPEGLFRVTLSLPGLLGGGSGCSKPAEVGKKDSNSRVYQVPHAASAASSSLICFTHDMESSPHAETRFQHLEQVQSTDQLASLLRTLPANDAEYHVAETLASQILETYAHIENKTPAHHREVLALGHTQNSLLTRSLLKILVKEYRQGELLDLELLEALNLTLFHAQSTDLDADDLMRVLRISFEKLNQLHIQEVSTDKLYQTLISLGSLLDLMGDSGILNTSREELHHPIYQALDKFSSYSELRIAAAAAYAKQSLVRIPSDESKFMSFVRRGIACV